MKKSISILLLFIFLLAQYGKVISYVYCKWEVRSEVHCDCEKILADEKHQGSDHMAALNFNSKWEEPALIQLVEDTFLYNIRENIYTEHYSYSLLKGFPGLPFHPPSVV